MLRLMVDVATLIGSGGTWPGRTHSKPAAAAATAPPPPPPPPVASELGDTEAASDENEEAEALKLAVGGGETSSGLSR